MLRRLVPLLGVVLFCCMPARLYGAIATFGLDVESVTASDALLNVFLTLTGNLGDSIDVVQLSVVGSDPLLTAGGTDFSRFSFLLNSTTLPSWREEDSLADDGLGLFSADFFGDYRPFSILDTREQIGQLRIDLAGLPGNTPLGVTLAEGAPRLQTDVAGIVGGGVVLSFLNSRTDDVAFNPPSASLTRVNTVPEPGNLTVWASGLLTAWLIRRRKRSA